MTTAAQLVHTLPIRAIKVQAGTYGNCGGKVIATVDLEPSPAGGFEFVHADAQAPDWAADLDDIAGELLGDIEFGIRSAFRDRLGADPSIRVVVRRWNAGPADMHKFVAQKAGRLIVEQVLGA